MRKNPGDLTLKNSAIQVNNKIEVALADEKVPNFGHSLVQQVFDDKFSVMMPLFEGRMLNFHKDDEVIVSTLVNNVRYSFTTTVLGKAKEGNLNLLVLKMPQSLELADRRTFIRIKTLLPVKYSILAEEQKGVWRSVAPDREAYLTDLSGKGLSISLDRMPRNGELLVIKLNLGNGTVMKVLGEIVRSEVYNERYRAGVKFKDITERQEDMIINYVFQCLRKTIRLNKED